jgi:hypothetical protein
MSPLRTQPALCHKQALLLLPYWSPCTANPIMGRCRLRKFQYSWAGSLVGTSNHGQMSQYGLVVMGLEGPSDHGQVS